MCFILFYKINTDISLKIKIYISLKLQRNKKKISIKLFPCITKENIRHRLDQIYVIKLLQVLALGVVACCLVFGDQQTVYQISIDAWNSDFNLVTSQRIVIWISCILLLLLLLVISCRLIRTYQDWMIPYACCISAWWRRTSFLSFSPGFWI